MTTEAGWYPDPQNAGRALFWSGTEWAGERIWNGTAWVDPSQPADRAPAPAQTTAPWPTSAPVAAPVAAPVPTPVAAPVVASPGFGPGAMSAGFWPGGTGPAFGPSAAIGAPKPPVPRRLRNLALLILGGTGLMVIGSMLPWASQDYVITTTTVHGTSVGGGEFSIVLALVIAALTGLALSRIVGPRKTGIWVLILGVLAISICIANMANVSDVIDQEKSSGITAATGAGTKLGAGLLVLLVGDLIVIAGAIMIVLSARRRISADGHF
jgi:hypothetical protein